MADAFQASIGWNFEPLISLRDVDMHIDCMHIDNTAVTDTPVNTLSQLRCAQPVWLEEGFVEEVL